MKKQMFYAPSEGRVAQLTTDENDKSIVDVVTRPFSPKMKEGRRLRLDELELDNEYAQMDRSRSPKKKKLTVSSLEEEVERARDEFDKLFTDFQASVSSEYDAKYTVPPVDAYRNRPHEVHPHDRLSWFLHDPSTSTTEDVSKYSHRKHVHGHVLGEESTPGPWVEGTVADRLTVSRSETNDRYRAPPKDWAAPKRFHEPPEQFNWADSYAPKSDDVEQEQKQRLQLETLRGRFKEEMSRIHRTDLDSDYRTEYSNSFINPAVSKSSGDSNGITKAAATYSSEYDAAFRQLTLEDLEKAKHQRPAGVSRGLETTISSKEVKRTTDPAFVTEYRASFIPQTDLTIAAELLEAKRKKESKRRDEELAKRAQETTEDKQPRKTKPLGLSVASTEYRDRYAHHGDTSMLDPGFIPSPRKKMHHHKDPLLSEYNVEFDHVKSTREIPKKDPPHGPHYGVTNGFVTEYEGSFCGYDYSEKEKQLMQQIRELDQKNALKPAYSLKPSEGKHKHKLFNAEINPGFVQKTEQMAKFVDPATVKGDHKKQALNTFKLPDAKRPPQESQQQLNKENASSVNNIITPSHDEILKAANTKNLHWWRDSGQRLWNSFNPITRNPRYGPDRYFATPKTEYQRSFTGKPSFK